MTPEWGQKVKTIFFLKMVILHIRLKERHIQQHARNNFVLTGTLDPWGGVKIIFLLKMVMLHILGMGIFFLILGSQPKI